MGCAGSSDGNTKHGQSSVKRAKPAGPRKLEGLAQTQSSSEFQDGIGPQQDAGGVSDGNENSISARSGGSQSAKNPLTPGSRPRDDATFSNFGGRPTSQQGRPMSRGVAKPHGARRMSSNNPAGHGSLAPTISPSNRRRSSAQNSTFDIPRASIDGGSFEDSNNPPPNGNNAAATFAFKDDGKAAPAVTSLPFHPRSRILPRKFNSRHDRSYKGMYRNKDNSDWEILTPQKRILAQDKELEHDDCAEAKGLAWPIVGTNWKHLKFASQDHHIADDLQSGNEADDDLVPLCALKDLPPADRDSEYLNGLRIKRTREHIAEAMKKVEMMCQQDENQISEIGPIAHECAVQCCRIGYIRLTSVFVALAALAVDFRLLIESPAEFLRALHQSCAIHFEEDFVSDTELRLPSNVGKLENDAEVEGNKVIVEFVDYLKARFKSDIVYCVAVARAVCDLNVDTRDLSTRGMPQGLRDAHKVVAKTSADINRNHDGAEKFDLGKEPSLTTTTGEKKAGLGTTAFRSKSTVGELPGDHTTEMVPMGASVYH